MTKGLPQAFRRRLERLSRQIEVGRRQSHRPGTATVVAKAPGHPLGGGWRRCPAHRFTFDRASIWRSTMVTPARTMPCDLARGIARCARVDRGLPASVG